MLVGLDVYDFAEQLWEGNLEVWKTLWTELWRKMGKLVVVINKRYPRIKEGGGLLQQINNCLNEEWEFRISHGHKEANHNAYAMANKSLQHELRLKIYEDYSYDLLHFFRMMLLRLPPPCCFYVTGFSFGPNPFDYFF